MVISIHEDEVLENVERRYPAAVTRAWGDRVTTVFLRQRTILSSPEVRQ